MVIKLQVRSGFRSDTHNIKPARSVPQSLLLDICCGRPQQTPLLDPAYGLGRQPEGWARVELTLPEGKQAVYVESVRAGMQDFIAAIRDPQHTPEVSPADGRNSLAVALAATRAAETGVWEAISYGGT